MQARGNTKFISGIFLFFFLCLGISHVHVAAQLPFNVTPEQIEQFKRLSPAEQRALAQSMGIDPSMIEAFLNAQSGQSAQVQPSFESEVSGRRVPVDEFGRPINNQDPNNRRLNQQGIQTQGGRPGEVVNESVRELAESATDDLSLEEDQGAEFKLAPIRLFGYDVFKYGADAFTPATDIPIPNDYVLGPGDAIIVQLYGKENRSETFTINREGQVQFTNLGPITIAGLSFQQVRDKIHEVVSQQMIGVNSSVTLGALRTIRVYVLGEAQVPGSYIVSSLSTMTNAIFASGGITEIGSLRNIQLKRAGKVITHLDLYDLLLNGDTSKDARLLPGDVIFIPPIGKTVGVAGEVKRPAIYELKNETRVAQVIELAGGLSPTAFVPASRIERITPQGEKTLVNLDLSTDRGKGYNIQDADVIQIFPTLDTMRDIVKLDGHVKRPGGFAWYDGIRFTDVVPSVDDMLANPDIEIGLILREEYKTRKIRVEVFYPRLAFENPNGQYDPFLKSRDTILLFDYETNRTEILEEVLAQLRIQADINERKKVINVYGSVRFPGEYPFAENITATDAVKLAGGYTESALGSDAEITRYDLDDQRNTVVMHLDINLKEGDSKLVEGDTLNVKQIPLWQIKENVQLLGEVIYPGTYSILPGETLMDVVNRAGGLTPHAYAEGAIFSRDELRRLEEERLADLREKIEADLAATNLTESVVSKTDVNKEQAAQILENIESVKPLGRMVINLPAIMKDPKSYDFQLRDGDVLNVPRYKPSVTVVGEVQYSTSHFYDERMSPMDYIERSGGTSQNADKKRIYIVKANGSVFLPSNSAWFKSRSQNIEPGDTVVVPIDTDKVDKLTLWSSITSILANMAQTVIIATRL